jgi:hypothetical protein
MTDDQDLRSVAEFVRSSAVHLRDQATTIAGDFERAFAKAATARADIEAKIAEHEKLRDQAAEAASNAEAAADAAEQAAVEAGVPGITSSTVGAAAQNAGIKVEEN